MVDLEQTEINQKITSLATVIEPVVEDPNEENYDSDSPTKEFPKISPENSDNGMKMDKLHQKINFGANKEYLRHFKPNLGHQEIQNMLERRNLKGIFQKILNIFRMRKSHILSCR